MFCSGSTGCDRHRWAGTDDSHLISCCRGTTLDVVSSSLQTDLGTSFEDDQKSGIVEDLSIQRVIEWGYTDEGLSNRVRVRSLGLVPT